MKHKDSGWVEPDITINGRTLTFGEAMAVRVAVSSMRISLSSRSCRQALGEQLSEGYDGLLAAVEQQMLETIK